MYYNLTDPPPKKDDQKSAQQLKQEAATEKAENQTPENMEEVSKATNVDTAILNEETNPPPTDESLSITADVVQGTNSLEEDEVVPDPASNNIVNGEENETEIF